MTICQCGLVHMISVDGGLRHIKPYLVNELQAQGWRIVTNPKRNYYIEYDTTLPNYQPQIINENVNNSDTLLVTKL